jgi:hypothetical protein
MLQEPEEAAANALNGIGAELDLLLGEAGDEAGDNKEAFEALFGGAPPTGPANPFATQVGLLGLAMEHMQHQSAKQTGN